MNQYNNIITKIKELSKNERIIFEKNYGENVQSFSKAPLKNHSELYEMLTDLSYQEITYVYKLAFPLEETIRQDKSFYIEKLFNCFNLDLLLPNTFS